MNEILNILKTGKVPEIPFVVKVENESILKLAAAVVVSSVIIILIANLLKK